MIWFQWRYATSADVVAAAAARESRIDTAHEVWVCLGGGGAAASHRDAYSLVHMNSELKISRAHNAIKREIPSFDSWDGAKSNDAKVKFI